ncbi:retrovirus-related pol polyprotein from transposon TNT 1-94 [Tanacetum coccineum]
MKVADIRNSFPKYFIRSFIMSLDNDSILSITGYLDCFSPEMLRKCVGRREILRYSFLITEALKLMISKRSPIISSNLFDLYIILVFYHPDKGHNHFRGKENGLQILQSIDQGPFELGTTRDTLETTPEGGVLLGPERPRTYEDLSDMEKKRYDADVRATNIVLQDLTKISKCSSITTLMLMHFGTTSKCFLPGETFFEYYVHFHKRSHTCGIQNVNAYQSMQWGAQNRAGNANAGQGKSVKCYNYNGVGHIAKNCTQPKRLQNSNYFKDKMLLMQAQENGAVLDEEELLFLAGEQGNTFDADVDECDAFDSDVDDEPIMLSYISWPICPQPGQQIHKLDEHEIHNEVQQSNVIDSTSVDMVVLIAFVPHDPIATELKTYKEQVAIYEQRAKFKLTKREQRMYDQMRMLIQNRNKTEENLKKELHLTKTALSTQNPCYLKQAKKAQPALYDGDELLKPHYVPVIVPSSEEELELAEATRNKLHVKMICSAMSETLVKTISLLILKRKFYGNNVTLKTQLTPEQVFWSLDLAKRKAEELKANAPPLPVLPPATVAMKAVFENLEAEVDQNEINLKSGEIEQKNLIITNENLLAECLSKDVFYTATDSVLNVSRFSDMHDAFTIAQKRIADLESEKFNLRNKIQNDDHDSMIKHFSKLEIEHFNLQLKYQNLKEHFGNKKPVTSSDAPSFDSLDAYPTLDLKALVSQNKDLTAKLNALHDLNERFRAENAKVKQHYKELYDSIKTTRAKTTDQNNSLLPEIENLKA